MQVHLLSCALVLKDQAWLFRTGLDRVWWSGPALDKNTSSDRLDSAKQISMASASSRVRKTQPLFLLHYACIYILPEPGQVGIMYLYKATPAAI